MAAAVPGADVRGLANPEAAAASDLVVLSVPFAARRRRSDRSEPRCAGHAAARRDRPARDRRGRARDAHARRAAGLRRAAGAGAGARRACGRRRRCTRSRARHLADLDHAFDEDVLLCGDDADAKARVAELIERIPGLRPVDAGRLEMARIVEQLTALTIASTSATRSRRASGSSACRPDGRRSSCSPAAPAGRSSRAGWRTSPAATRSS